MRHFIAPLLLVLLVRNAVWSNAGETSRYMRNLLASGDLPLDSPYFAVPPGYNAPEQVHITQGDFEGSAVIISWITAVEPGVSEVYYGRDPGKYTETAVGKFHRYKFFNQTSGFIHHTTIKNLEYNTKYYYQLGKGDAAREFWFFTPPASTPDTPYTFGIIGDLGQTYDSLSTLEHYKNSSGQALLMVGDLSYSDHYNSSEFNVRWDTWGRLVESSTAYQPWIWTAGNHELDYYPELGETVPFKPYTHRYHTPFKTSNSTSPLWYSIRRGPATIIVLSSYSAYGKYTPQYRWLLDALAQVDRTITPWLIVLLHSPWYNSNIYHYMEGETMRVILEPFLVQYQVDVVFSGHVHSYERTYPVSNIKYNIVNGLCTPEVNQTAPTYIVIGDGGNVEGPAGIWSDPQPAYSAYREASFGHGVLDIANRTHALFTWHRNQDGEKVVADSTILLNKYYS